MTGKPKALFSQDVHHWIYYVCLCILVASMPTSRFMMSFIQIIMGLNWLLEGHYRDKWTRFTRNKPALIFSSLFLVQVTGLLWSQELIYGITGDLKDKLPMLTLTFLVISSKPLTRLQVHLLLYLFFASVLVTSFIGFYVYITGSYVNFRHISPYISHVYLSMMVVMTIFTLPWLTKNLTQDRNYLILSLVVSLWLIVFLLILRSMTGILCLAGVVAFLLIRTVFRPVNIWKRIAAPLVLLVILLPGLLLIMNMYGKVSHEVVPDQAMMNDTTSLGNRYRHDPENILRENGHLVYHFLAENELRKAWNKRSNLDYDTTDMLGNELKATLFRYMSSKGYPKDKEHLNLLTDEDIRAIETGTPNYLYNQWTGLLVRIHQTIWEIYWYRQTGDPTGHTFTQRMELWRGSWEAFKQKPLLGWGTGDIFIAVGYGLEKIDSQMENHRMKPHNQYLLLLLTLGIIGTLITFGLYLWFITLTKAYRYLPFSIFIVIMLISMIGNNPIDAQAGQTFFSFFTLYFGFLYSSYKRV